jgi:hypothetical protein
MIQVFAQWSHEDGEGIDNRLQSLSPPAPFASIHCYRGFCHFMSNAPDVEKSKQMNATIAQGTSN